MSKLYREIYKLKNLLRKGWVMTNAKDSKTGRVESDAEHTFSMSILAMEIMAKDKKYSKLDKAKVYEMILVHELCEIDVGDHTPFDEISKEEKYKQEFAGVKRIAKDCDMLELIKLWQEFEENKTEEAKFVKKMDRLDAVMQSKIYSEEINNENLYLEFRNNEKNNAKQVADEFRRFL